MRKLFERDLAVPAEVMGYADLDRGEKVLAATRSRDGSWLLGTRRALVVVRPSAEVTTLPWEQVQSADWSRDEDRLRVHEVGEFGRTRPVHEFTLDDPGKLLTIDDDFGGWGEANSKFFDENDGIITQLQEETGTLG